MTPGRFMAGASAAVALTMIVVYLVLVYAQGNRPAYWFVGGWLWPRCSPHIRRGAGLGGAGRR